MLQTFMEWGGCAFGVAGSLMLALKVKRSGWGFVFYLFSNAAWVVFGVATGVYGLVLQHGAFTATSAFGVWRWLVAPWLRQGELAVYRGEIIAPQGERFTFDFVAPTGATSEERDAEAFRALAQACRGELAYQEVGRLFR